MRVTTKHVLRMAVLILAEHEIAAKARKLRNQICAMNQGAGYYTSHGIAEGRELTISMSLPAYLSLFPESQPELVRFESKGLAYGRLHYKAQHVGEAKGLRVLIDAWSDKFNIPTLNTNTQNP